MDMDFVLSCALVRPQRLVSSCCPSARTFAPRFLQTSTRGDALALRYPSPPSGWERDLHPPSTGTCPAHLKSVEKSITTRISEDGNRGRENLRRFAKCHEGNGLRIIACSRAPPARRVGQVIY